MKRLLPALLFLASTAHAADEAKIVELLRITDMEKTYAGMMQQSGTYFTQMKRQVAADNALSPQQKEAVERAFQIYLDKAMAEYSWEKMQPFMVSVYSELFTDQEIDDMIAFYRTPSGKAVMAKSPQVFQKSMQHLQGRMTTLIAELQQTLGDELAKATPPKAPASKAATRKKP